MRVLAAILLLAGGLLIAGAEDSTRSSAPSLAAMLEGLRLRVDPTNPPSTALSPRAKFMRLATAPLFPRGRFQPGDHLRPSSLGLHVEILDGQPVVATSVGLGMTPRAAENWLAPLSEQVIANYDYFEFAYRVALVPLERGGPGFSFEEARQIALQMAMSGKTWPPSTDHLTPAQSLVVRETNRRTRVRIEVWPGYYGWPYCFPWWGWYEYPSTANPPASFSEQVPRWHHDSHYGPPRFPPPNGPWAPGFPPRR